MSERRRWLNIARLMKIRAIEPVAADEDGPTYVVAVG